MNTKKDFEATARIIAREAEHTNNENITAALCRMAGEFADMYERDNPRFDRARFLKAAGITEVE